MSSATGFGDGYLFPERKQTSREKRTARRAMRTERAKEKQMKSSQSKQIAPVLPYAERLDNYFGHDYKKSEPYTPYDADDYMKSFYGDDSFNTKKTIGHDYLPNPKVPSVASTKYIEKGKPVSVTEAKKAAKAEVAASKNVYAPSLVVMPCAVRNKFLKHLKYMLTLRNASADRSGNLLYDYCLEQLVSFGRVVDTDLHGNIMSIGDDVPGLGYRGCVGHTDSVGQRHGEDVEPIVLCNGRWHSKNGLRPIGGDDKVGVAIALTLAEFRPELSCILPADEEIGCVGSRRMDFPVHQLLVQADRRGSTDLVHTIGGAKIATSDCLKWAAYLLPHRTPATGMMTDVEAFSERGLCGNAFNLSCGYYFPHQADEFVVISQAMQTLYDAWALLLSIPQVAHLTEADKFPYRYNPTKAGSVLPGATVPAKVVPAHTLITQNGLTKTGAIVSGTNAPDYGGLMYIPTVRRYPAPTMTHRGKGAERIELVWENAGYIPVEQSKLYDKWLDVEGANKNLEDSLVSIGNVCLTPTEASDIRAISALDVFTAAYPVNAFIDQVFTYYNFSKTSLLLRTKDSIIRAIKIQRGLIYRNGLIEAAKEKQIQAEITELQVMAASQDKESTEVVSLNTGLDMFHRTGAYHYDLVVPKTQDSLPPDFRSDVDDAYDPFETALIYASRDDHNDDNPWAGDIGYDQAVIAYDKTYDEQYGESCIRLSDGTAVMAGIDFPTDAEFDMCTPAALDIMYPGWLEIYADVLGLSVEEVTEELDSISDRG